MGNRWTRLRTREVALAALLAVSFTAAPFAAFVARNREEIASVAPVLRYGAITSFITLGILLAVLLGFHRAGPGPVGAAVGAVAFLAFQWSWFARGPLALQYAQWLAASAGAAWLAVRLARHPEGRLFLVLVGLGLVAPPTLSYLEWHSGDGGERAAGAAVVPSTSSSPPATTAPPGETYDRPNVWFFVLDGYGRADQLQRVLGHDDSAFLADLAERGFTVRDDAFSSYPATYLSVTSMLEMEHVATVPADLDGGHRTYYRRLQGDNAAVRSFKARGYRYVHAESGTYAGTHCNAAYLDLCIAAREDRFGPTLGELEFSLLRLTPARPLLDAGVLPLGDSFTDPPGIVATLREQDPAEPYFVFAHIVAPHAPFRRAADCSHRSRNVGAIGEGWEPGMKDDYVAALECLHAQTLEAIDTILRDDPEAVIVLTGDHGSGFTVDFEQPLDSWTPEQIAERLAVFHAVRLPEPCPRGSGAAAAAAGAGVVNALRVVLACVDGRPAALLPRRAFLYRYGEHELVELTASDDLEALLRH